MPIAKRIACSNDALYVVDGSGDVYAWNYDQSREGDSPVRAQNLHAVADIQPHLGNIARPHCLISQSGGVSCWAFQHALGDGDWVSWEAGSERKPFDATTSPLLKGVDLEHTQQRNSPP